MTGSALRIILSVSLGIGLTFPASRVRSDSPARPRTGCAAEAQPDLLQNLSQDGDLILASGRAAKLASIRLPVETPYREQALAWLQARRGEPVLVRAVAGPDRWNRISVRIRSSNQSPSLVWSHGLIEAGLAITDADPNEPFCEPELLALEATARERHLGLWADDRYKPLDVNRPEHLRDRIGSFVLIEGRVRSIGERKQRTYLNFGGLWAEDFTIIIPKKTWKQMSDRGMGADALEGWRIRARGILQPWQGTAFSIVIPDMIERLEGGRLPR